MKKIAILLITFWTVISPVAAQSRKYLMEQIESISKTIAEQNRILSNKLIYIGGLHHNTKAINLPFIVVNTQDVYEIQIPYPLKQIHVDRSVSKAHYTLAAIDSTNTSLKILDEDQFWATPFNYQIIKTKTIPSKDSLRLIPAYDPINELDRCIIKRRKQKANSYLTKSDMKNKSIKELKELYLTYMEIFHVIDEIVNERYLKIASKAELRKEGLLTGGFLKKSKIDFSKIDKQQFRTIDIRYFTELEIDSKNPKILTDVPTDSYTLEKKDNKTILRITDPVRFWGLSNFLIIQSDL